MTQNEALAIMHSGQSVLLTGAAGAGKTYALNSFIRRARANGKSVAVTATTGLAATHLNGTTIHAWSGIGIHDELPKNHYIKMSKQRKDLINKADILIIDEVSMLHDYRLDMIEQTCRNIRDIDEPFGGIQVILSGDFFQLPPVNRHDSVKGGFVTSSNIWQEDIFTICYLSEQHRQKDDQQYTDILNGIRAGVLTGRQIASLKNRQNANLEPIVTTTKLLTTNVDVDVINKRQLDTLESDSAEYTMTLSGRKKYVEQLLRSCLAPEVLQLKIGAQVMCIKNSPDKKYVNGSLGVVVNFEHDTDYPVIKLNNGKQITVKPETWELIDGDQRRASCVQIPLRLAWAITVHKSQGMTLDSAQIDLSKAFVEGMGYVALSRVKNMDFLVLDGLNGMALQVSPVAKELDKTLRKNSEIALKNNQKVIKQWLKDESKRPKDIIVQSKTGTWSEKLAKMRSQYPNAYTPWKEDDDIKLVKEFSDGMSISKLSKLLGRHKGSIKARLEKHFGEDAFTSV